MCGLVKNCVGIVWYECAIGVVWVWRLHYTACPELYCAVLWCNCAVLDCTGLQYNIPSPLGMFVMCGLVKNYVGIVWCECDIGVVWV